MTNADIQMKFEILLKGTNKASFDLIERAGELVLKKTYFRIGSAEKDFNLLLALKKYFRPRTVNNFVYRPLDVFAFDSTRNWLEMELFPGESIGSHYDKYNDVSIFYHMGMWLGLLHSQSVNETGHVVCFNDYNRTNCLIDFDKNIVTALDPGHYHQMYVDPGISFVMGLFSVTRGAARVNPLSYFPGGTRFVAGYVEQGVGLTFLNHLRGARYLLQRLASGSSRTVTSKFIGGKLIGFIEVSSLFVFSILACKFMALRLRKIPA